MGRACSIPLVVLLGLPCLASCDRDDGSAARAAAIAHPGMRVDLQVAPPEMRVDREVVSAPESGSLAGFARQLPEFSVADPNGKQVSRDSLAKAGLVLVVTAPTAANQTAQEGWAKALQDARGASKAGFAFLEDMQQSSFKDTARGRMKDEYTPERGPILLIDEAGALRRSLQVAEDLTVVLVYDAAGKLVLAEGGEPGADRARTAWKRASGE